MELRDGRAFARGDARYEAARRATVWNARLPDRFPDVIVQAETELVHCAQEMGHLAARLPDLHAEFGAT
jgi:hypothetical protein